MMLAFCTDVSVSKRAKFASALRSMGECDERVCARVFSEFKQSLSQKALASVNAVFSRTAESYERLLENKGIGYVTVLDDEYPKAYLS